MDRDCTPFSNCFLIVFYPCTYDESTNKRTYNKYNRIFRFSAMWPEGRRKKHEVSSIHVKWKLAEYDHLSWMLEDKLGQSVSDPNPAWDLSFLFTAPILDNLQANIARIRSLIKTMARGEPRCHFHSFLLSLSRIFFLFFRMKILENWNIKT